MEKGNYTEEDREFMRLTNMTRSASRFDELVNFIKLNGYTKIGIANCFSVNKLALKLKDMLEEKGISAITVHCKESKLDSAEISAELKGPSCDPKSQAQYLNEEKTDLNINFGLCLGHGILFQKYSVAPVTTFLVKDACHKHNIMENFCEC